jgi:hypothetical protein
MHFRKETLPPLPFEDEGTIISALHSERGLKVNEVHFVATMPEYPNTSETGIAYVVHTLGMSDEEVKLQTQAVLHTIRIHSEYILNIL